MPQTFEYVKLIGILAFFSGIIYSLGLISQKLTEAKEE